MSTRAWKNWLKTLGRKTDRPAKRRDPSRLSVVELEARSTPAVVAVLQPGGVLDIGFDAENDAATISTAGGKILVDDGSGADAFDPAAVTAINAHGDADGGQQVTITGGFTLTNALTVTGLELVAIREATIAAGSADVLATGPVSLTGSKLTATGPVTINSSVATSGVAGRLVVIGTTFTADAAVTLTDSFVGGSNVTISAAAVVTASAAGDTADDTNRDLARVVTKANAKVNIGGTSRIEAPGFVTITADADNTTTGTALAKTTSNNPNLDAAVAFSNLTTSATIDLSGTAAVVAGGAATFSATNDAAATTTADGSAGGTAAVGGSVARAALDSVTRTAVTGGATVSAADVNILATSGSNLTTTARSTVGGSTGNDADTKQELADGGAKTSDGPVGVAGAFAFNRFVRHETQAFITSSGAVTATNKVHVGSTSTADANATADGSVTGSGSDTPVGVGVAVAIDRGAVLNQAFLGGTGTVGGKAVSVEALMPAASDFTASAKAGAGAKNVGVAGALAINAVDTTSEALVKTGAAVNLAGADLTLSAVGNTVNTVDALPNGVGGAGGKVGIGASVALNTITRTTRALVDRDASVAGADDLTIGASGGHTTTTTATTGAEGGVAVTPGVALSLVTSTNTARVGTGPNLSATGNVSIAAAQTGSTTAKASGAAAGDKVAVGAALGLTRVLDTADASIGRNLTAAGNVSVLANTSANSRADGLASAKGTTSTQSADEQIDQQDADPTRQSGSTSQGKLGAAAALGINLPTSRANAVVGASVTAGGTVTLDTANQTTAAAKADGTAVVPGSVVGVGVAFGLNAANVESEARLESGATVKASALTIHAGTPAAHAFTADALSGAGAKEVGVAGSLAINKVTNASQALFRPGATANVTGAVNLTADGQSTGTTTAAPAPGGATGATLGVGASVALGIFANTVRAEVEDEARLTKAGAATLKATATHTVTTSAQGGAGAETAAGAVAVTPVVGITVATNKTTARLGKAAAGSSSVTGAVLVEATHTGATTTTAAGTAIAAKAAVGVALGLNIVTDEATALVGSASAGGAVTVRASSAATSTADAKASAVGGPTSSDKSVDVTVEENKNFGDANAGTSTQSAPSAKAPDAGAAGQASGGVAVAAAVGVNLGRSRTRAGVEDNGAVTAGGLLTVSGSHNADSAAKADGSTVAGATPPPQGVGVAGAVAINATTVSDEATIGKMAVVSGRGVKLETATKTIGNDIVSTSAATANSGAGAKNVGVAGSFAINVANNDSTAAALAGASVTAGLGLTADDLTVTAAQTTSSVASATAKVPVIAGSSTKVGVGGSIGIVVADNSTRAAVEDAAILFGANDISVTSAGTHTQTANATAGSSGGVAVSPSVGLVVGLSDTTASLGSGPVVNLTGNLLVQTAHTGISATSTNADAAGKDVAVGTTVGLTVADDVSTAFANRSVTAAGGVTVFAQSDANAATNATASANGGSTQQAGDEVGDRYRAYGKDLKTTFSSDKSFVVELGKALDDASKRAEEFAGANPNSVGVAGAVGVTIALADASAVLGGGTISAGGAVQVKTAADADQDADAQGLAAGLMTGTGVGAALAVNVAVTKNRAEIAPNAIVTGSSVTVSATQPAADARQTTAQALAGGGGNKTGVAGSLAVNVASDETKALVGNGAAVTSKGALTVEARSSFQPQAVAGGAALGIQNGAVGAGFAVNVILADTKAYLDANSKADVAGATTIAADTILAAVDGSIPNDPLATAVGGTLSADGGVAGSVSVNVVSETTHAFVGAGAKINDAGPGGAGQSVLVRAKTDNTLTSAAGVAQLGVGATQFGLGATVTVLTHDTLAFVAPNAVVRAGGNLTLDANSEEDAKSFAASIGASGSNQVSGSVGVYVPITKTRAFFDAGSTGESNGNTKVAATHDADIETVVGNGSGAGSNAIGGAFSVIVTTDTTEAFVGANAKLTARGATGLTVEAKDLSNVTPLAVSGSGAGGTGIAGSGSITNLNPTTTAHVDTGAKLTATNTTAGIDPSVRVAAISTTTLLGIAGAATLGGSGGVGAGADVNDLDKDTQAWIARGVVVTADRDVAVVAESFENIRSVSAAVNAGGTAAIGGAAGVLTLDLVTRAALGETPGVASNAAATQVTADGNVIVSADDRTRVDVIAGTAAGAGGVGVGGSAAVPVVKKTTESYVAPGTVVQANGKAATTARTGRFDVATGGNDSFVANEVRLPQIDPIDSDGDTLNDLTDPTLSGQRTGSPATAALRGVAVTATSLDDIETIAVGAAGAGSVAVGLGAPVARINPTTTAFIGAGAKVNAANGSADPNQSVLVAAGSDVYYLGIGGAAAGAGSVAAGPAGVVAVITPTTTATVNASAQVNAALNVTVQADATQDVVMIGAGAAGAGIAGVAGAVDVLKLESKTTASVGSSATVTAGETVSVLAKDTSDLDLIAGSAGFGGVAGVGGSAGVVLVVKQTKALIGTNAVVEGKAIGTDTTPLQRGVVVRADSTEDVLNIAAAGSLGIFAGVAGGVVVTIVDSDTDARVAAGAKVNPTTTGAGAAQGAYVNATNAVKVLSVGGGLAAGVGALGGGVDVGTLRNDTSAAVDASAAVRAAGDVEVIADASKDVRGVALSGAAGLVGLNASVSVWSIGTPFTSTYTNGDGTTGTSDNALDDGSGGGSNQFADDHAGNQAGQAHGRVTANLDAFNSSTVDLTGLTQTPVQRLGQGVRTSRLGLTGLPTSSNITSSLDSTVAQPGTTAVVAAGATVTAGDAVTVAARGDVDVDQLAGGVSVGGAAIGASVAVLNTSGLTDAHVSGIIDAAGDVTVAAEFGSQIVDAKSLSGKVGLVGLGAAVAVVTDTSSQKAFIASTGEIRRAATLTVNAEADQNIGATTGSLAVTGLQAGASYARSIADGKTEAYLDFGAKIGQTAGLTVTNVSVTADSNIDADAEATAVSVGLLFSADVNFTRSEVTPDVSARVKGGALVTAGNDVTIQALSDADAFADTVGDNVGAGAVGINRATARAVPVTTAKVENATIAAGHDVTVRADADFIRARADAEGSSGGLLFGAGGSKAVADSLPVVLSEIRSAVESSTTVSAGHDVNVLANADVHADAGADNNSTGLIAVGAATATGTADPTVTATVGGGSLVSIDAGNNVLVEGKSTVEADADADSAGTGLIPQSTATGTATATFDTRAVADDNAFLTAGNLATIRSVIVDVDASADQARADGRGIGGGSEADAIANVGQGGNNRAQLRTEVDGQASVSAPHVALSSVVEREFVEAEADALDSGATRDGNTNAFARADIAVTAQVVLETGSNVTGTESVDIDARHNSASNRADAFSDDFLGAVGTASTSRANQVTDAFVTAQNNSFVTTRNLTVDVSHTPTQLISVAIREAVGEDNVGDPFAAINPARTITWEATTKVLGGPDPELVISGQGSVTKAIGVTINDSDGKTLGLVESPTIVVNPITYPAPTTPQVRFTANVVSAFGNTVDGVVGGTNGEINYVRTPGKVTITNASLKPLSVGSINVIGTGQPSTQVSAESVPLAFNSTHLYPPTEVTIENTRPTGAQALTLTGAITNPVGMTRVVNERADIAVTAAGLIETRDLELSAPLGSVGSAASPVRVNLVQSDAADTDVTADAANTLALQLAGRLRRVLPAGTPFTVAVDSLQAGGALDLRLADGLVQNTTTAAHPTSKVVETQFSPDKITTVISRFRPPSEEFPAPLPLGVFGTGSATTDTTFAIGSATAGGALTVNDIGAKVATVSGPLTAAGSLTFSGTPAYAFQINGTTPGTGFVTSAGNTVNLNGAALKVTAPVATPVDTKFTLVSNTGTAKVNGTFAGLPEGTEFLVNDLKYGISYQGGDGNDVVLTRVNTPSMFTNRFVTETDEGGVAMLHGIVVDPDPEDTFRLTIDWGDGTTEEKVYPAGTKGIAVPHLYRDEQPNGKAYVVDLDWRDPHGGGNKGKLDAVVHNVAPTIAIGPDRGVQVNQPVLFTAAITDPGVDDTHKVSWVVRDEGGQEVDHGNGPDFTFTPSGPGVYTVTAEAKDDDGGIGTDAATVTVTTRR